MNSEQLLLNKWRTLTPTKQEEVLNFIDSLTPQSSQTEWQYLEQRPHSWRKQLYLKGRRLKAFDLYKIQKSCSIKTAKRLLAYLSGSCKVSFCFKLRVRVEKLLSNSTANIGVFSIANRKRCLSSHPIRQSILAIAVDALIPSG